MTHHKPFYSGTVFETLNLDGTPENPTRTLSHGWSSGPTSALSKYVLRVRPIEPGYQSWLVEPKPRDLCALQQPNGRAGYLYLQNLRPGAHLFQVTVTRQ